MTDYPHSLPGHRLPLYSNPDADPSPPPPPARYVGGGRTPSPTPSEVAALTSNIFSMKKYMNWRFWARKDWIVWYIIGFTLLVFSILVAVFDKQIVHWLTPAGQWMRSLTLGWLIPIAILFILSFPPLFGHEIIAILVGVIWGLGVGFAIVAAGTFLGEVGNYYAFKYCCRARGEKMEKGNMSYACLARVVRDGGFKVALIIRLSVIPGHFSTAVFSTCGMSIFIFALAAFLSLPKQLITVYIGVIIEESGAGAESTRDLIISRAVLAVTILITAGAMYYVWREINLVKPIVIYERRKARQVKMAGAMYGMENASVPTLYQQDSEADLPLSVMPQRPAQFAFNQPQRAGSGNYAGHGGYTAGYGQGPYGESFDPDDERKSTEAVGWETRGARVDDMRGAKWARHPGHGSDEEDGSTESAATVAAPDPVLPPALPPPDAYRPPAAASALPNPHDEQPQPPRHVYQLSDPPVAYHTPLPSDATGHGYAPADVAPYPPPSGHGYAQTDVLPERYAHAAQPTDASYGSQYPLGGHVAQPTDATDASYYTAGGAPSREPSSANPYLPPPANSAGTPPEHGRS